MSASVASSSLAGVTVITQVYPSAPGAQGGPPLGPQGATQRRLLALGTVQIMIGLLVLLFGIGMVIPPNSIAVFSGIFVWGAVFYILAGSLTVAATRSMDRCKVNAALTLSIIATVPSGVAVILHFIDASGLVMIWYYGYYDNYGYYGWQTLSQAMSAVLGIFSLLEFIVAITVAVEICKAKSHSNTQSEFIMSNNLPSGLPANMQAPPTSAVIYQTMELPKEPENKGAADLCEPPAYTTTVG
ncbi:membrane-spanning 4-domains subfamily A member 12-like [Myripristis murdjan]|uniref:Membrane-spanning 4-domains subfamily A member 12-like n=1 Tax=Myripristis murdjan TaxID=586833 RepID=A0A667YFT2_9TELE|nr:membrane-spanning 4-domains subfamily A member 12-like [Myripristis murdjan]